MADEHWCFAWDPTVDPKAGKGRAALLLKNRWPKAATITAAFLDGEPTLIERVKKAVQEWTQPDTANLRVIFVNNPAQADIRISFKYNGSWSSLGTSCHDVPKDQPTMNYGWLKPSSTDAEVRRVVTHEFGHALGLIHEHQNPVGAVPWNKDAVYRSLGGPPNNWSKEQIDENMFKIYERDEVSATEVDPTSIMMYPIPASWVTDPKYATGMNPGPSPTDKAKIKEIYP
jgi:serralysin